MKAIMEWDHAHLSKGYLQSSNINFILRMQILTSNHVYSTLGSYISSNL